MKIYKGEYNSWLMPDFLYHGTATIYKNSILRNGLLPDRKKKNSILSQHGVYMTTRRAFAYSTACNIAAKTKSQPLIIIIPVDKLNPDYLSFDINLALPGCSCAMAYSKKVTDFHLINNFSKINTELFSYDIPDDINKVVWDLDYQYLNENVEKYLKSLD